MSSALKLVLFFLTLFFLSHQCWRISVKYNYGPNIKAAAVKSLKLLRDRDSASVNA